MSIPVDNKAAKRKLATFRMLLAMRGARMVQLEHGIVEIVCRKGDEDAIRSLAFEHGIAVRSGV